MALTWADPAAKGLMGWPHTIYLHTALLSSLGFRPFISALLPETWNGLSHVLSLGPLNKTPLYLAAV